MCVNSPRGWHFGTKTWLHPTAWRLQCWDASGQAANWVGTQPHPSADRLPKDFLNPQPPLDIPLDTAPAHQRTKTQPHPPRGRDWPLPPGSLHKPLEQPHPPGGRHQQQENYSLTACRSSLQTQARHYPGTSWPLALGGVRGECTAGTDRMSPTEGHFSKIEKRNQPTTYIKIQVSI